MPKHKKNKKIIKKMAKVFEASEELTKVANEVFEKTDLHANGLKLRVLAITKSAVLAKAAKPSATADYLLGNNGNTITLTLLESVITEMESADQYILIEGALSGVSYDYEKEKINVDNNVYNEVIRMTNKYSNYIKILEKGKLIKEQQEEQAKELKQASK